MSVQVRRQIHLSNAHQNGGVNTVTRIVFTLDHSSNINTTKNQRNATGVSFNALFLQCSVASPNMFVFGADPSVMILMY